MLVLGPNSVAGLNYLVIFNKVVSRLVGPQFLQLCNWENTIEAQGFCRND